MMKPLSERIKSFSADQFIDWLCLACVDVREVRTEEDAQAEINTIRSVVTERLSALEQESQKNLEGASAWQRRAEAAERTHSRESLQHIDSLESLRDWKKRAEAAEAKLAELDKQDPAGYLVRTQNGALNFSVHKPRPRKGNSPAFKVFTRPAPAINLAELVPEEMPVDIPFAGHRIKHTGWNACRAAILRNIEEQLK